MVDRPSPYTSYPETYLDVVGDCLSRAQEGADEHVLTKRVYDSYHELDPLCSVALRGEDARSLFRGFNSALLVIRSASESHILSKRIVKHAVQLRLESLAMSTQIGDPSVLVRESSVVKETESSLRVHFKEQHDPGQPFDSISLPLAFDVFNISAIRARLDLERKKQERIDRFKDETVKDIGSLACECMRAVVKISAELDERPGGRLPDGSYSEGRIAELIFFVRQLINWHESENLDMVTRLAFDREDQNSNPGRARPRRTFDLVDLSGQPVQVKYLCKEEQPYAPEIQMCYLNEPCDPEIARQLMSWVAGIVSRENSPQQRTKYANQLQDYFSRTTVEESTKIQAPNIR